MDKLWFRAKRFGWGWYPCSWQGWLITLAGLAAILSISYFIEVDSTLDTVLLFSGILAVAIVLSVIAYKTGEKPRWRWG